MSSLIIVFSPLLSFFITGLLAVLSKKASNFRFSNFLSWVISCISLGFATSFAVIMYLIISKIDFPLIYKGFNWVSAGSFYVNFSFHFDVLSSIMVMLICFISFLVHFYSYFYMKEDDNIARFFAYLNLFTFSMLFLVVSDNLLQMFIGWELISLCSYLLISFYFEKDSANYAAEKGFLVNRFADIAFILGIFIIFVMFGNLNITDIAKNINNHLDDTFSFFGIEGLWLNVIGFLFLIAAFAKSAQLFFHVWLPDAMEAPTPVSALLHAATMVTAGVFLLTKLSVIYNYTPVVNNFILIFSGITTLYAAVVACFQTDIKKIIAFSTISQLGYMFLAIGSGFYTGAIFHLFTHAFFKALLFLSAGSIICSVGEQNINKMGGLWNKIPLTYLCMIIGSLALIGVPLFSGFYSKEAILHVLLEQKGSYVYFAFLMGTITIFFTTIYSFKLLLTVFHGSPKYSNVIEPRESNLGMILVLIVLAVLSVVSGNIGYEYFIGEQSRLFWNHSIIYVTNTIETNSSPYLLYLSLSLTAIAFIISVILFAKSSSLKNKLYKMFKGFSDAFYNKLYLDAFYDFIVLKFIPKTATFLNKINDEVIDRLFVNSLASFLSKTSKLLNKLQNGHVGFYAGMMLFGTCVLITYCILILGI